MGPSIRNRRKKYLLYCNVHRIDNPYSSTVGCERVFLQKFIFDEQVLLRCTYINYNTSICTHGPSIFLDDEENMCSSELIKCCNVWKPHFFAYECQRYDVTKKRYPYTINSLHISLKYFQHKCGVKDIFQE